MGDIIDAIVVSTKNGIELGVKLGGRDRMGGEMLEQAKAAGIPVEGTVTGVNKGGIEVSIGGTRAFCPLGQIDVNFVDDPNTLIGKTMQFLVREIREGGRNVVLSRRALVEAERRVQGDALKKTLEVGSRVKGTVTRITDFGVFVDLGGVDGMVPLSELAHTRVKDAREYVKEGDQIEANVTRLEDDPKRPGQMRIGLSIKALQGDPFADFVADAPVGRTFPGTIAKLETFGAFIEVAPGVQGLAHISELSNKRVRMPSDVVKVGDSVQARVLSIDESKKRISLSLKDASTSSESLQSGQTLEVTVGKAERGGVLVTLPNGAEGFLPSAETGTPPGTELGRVFAPGSKHHGACRRKRKGSRQSIEARPRHRRGARAGRHLQRQRVAASRASAPWSDLLKQRSADPKGFEPLVAHG